MKEPWWEIPEKFNAWCDAKNRRGREFAKTDAYRKLQEEYEETKKRLDNLFT